MSTASEQASAVALPPVSRTALWVAALRAEESARDDRAFEDPWARRLAGAEYGVGAALAGPDAERPLNHLVLRTVFVDAVVRDAARQGIRQFALLGAGMDTRAYRLGLPPDAIVFEVDLPATLAYKDAVLASAGARPDCRRVTVGLAEGDPWGPALRDAGFRPGEPTLWSAEGLLLYLGRHEVAALLDTVTALSGPGSVLVLDAFPASLVEDPRLAAWVAAWREAAVPLRTFVEDPVTWAAAFGWSAAAWTAADVRAGRCPWAPAAPRRVADAFMDRGWVVRAEPIGRP